MSSTIIKICGITRAEDGLAALAAGADWLGFIRWPGSKRFRPIEDCAETLGQIREATGREFHAVGVYVDASPELMREEIGRAGFDQAQLHGDETMQVARDLPVPAIKVIKVRDAESLKTADQYEGLTLLTDTADARLPGGTGRRYDVSLLAELAGRRRVIVAGGLGPDNIAEVIGELRPYGVDVSSGVEIEPGIKDAGKIEAFVRAARGAESSSK